MTIHYGAIEVSGYRTTAERDREVAEERSRAEFDVIHVLRRETGLSKEAIRAGYTFRWDGLYSRDVWLDEDDCPHTVPLPEAEVVGDRLLVRARGG
jgi:hypothetical protein